MKNEWLRRRKVKDSVHKQWVWLELKTSISIFSMFVPVGGFCGIAHYTLHFDCSLLAWKFLSDKAVVYISPLINRQYKVGDTILIDLDKLVVF